MSDTYGQKPQWEARLSEAAARIEKEIRAAVQAVDTEVIPEVRRHGSSALRSLAGQLEKLAVHLDEVRAEAEKNK